MLIEDGTRCTNVSNDTHLVPAMRTNIEIDDRLIAEAMAASGLPTKKATVEAGLKALLERHRQIQAIAALEGIGWEGDLMKMRESSPADWDR